MFSVSVLLLFLIAQLSSLAAGEGTRCGVRLPAYMVIENSKPISKPDRFYNNLTEFECTYSCSDNRDKSGDHLACSSFNYVRKEKGCYVYFDKVKPSGDKEIMSKQDFKYYEKFCLPEGSPLECGEGKFMRTEQRVLNGFAINATRTKKVESCIEACLVQKGCKSLMFFYEAGECIMNSGTAADSDEGLEEENQDKVVFIENGCFLEKVSKGDDKEDNSEGLREKSESETVVKEVEGKSEKEEKSATMKEKMSTTSEKPSSDQTTSLGEGNLRQKSEEFVEVINDEEKQGADDKNDKPHQVTSWSQWSDCDRPKDGRQVRRRSCKASTKVCRGKLLESRPCSPEAEEKEEEEETTIGTTLKIRSTTPKAVAEEKPVGAWSVWSKKCQPFQTGSICENGKKVGFQTRTCLGTPFECHGPSLRYCFITC